MRTCLWATVFFFLWRHSPLSGLGLPIGFRNLFRHTVGLLGWVISSSQDLSTYTKQHKHRINVQLHINIHASSRNRTYDPGIQASQNSSYLRPEPEFTAAKLFLLSHQSLILGSDFRVLFRFVYMSPSPRHWARDSCQVAINPSLFDTNWFPLLVGNMHPASSIRGYGRATERSVYHTTRRSEIHAS
jgi:hypothetical protein